MSNPITISNTPNGKNKQATSVNFMLNNNMDGGNTNNTIFVPNKNFNYGKVNDSADQFLTTSNNDPSTISADGILKWDNANGEIKWVKDLVSLGEFPNKISDTISRTLPLGDFFTDIQTNVDNFNTSTNNLQNSGESADSKYKWINLNASVNDVGLHQLTWNINKQYYSTNELKTNQTLLINCDNSLDNLLGFRVKYLAFDDLGNLDNFEISRYYQSIQDYNEGQDKISCFKVNSVELLPGVNNRTTNLGNIEFYFQLDSSAQNSETQVNNGIETLTMAPINESNCFSYNCEYLNCQYYNLLYTNRRSLRNNSSIKVGENTNFTNLSNITTYIPTGIYELEGGVGRKATIKITNNSTDNTNGDIDIQILNRGYLYEEGDLLRIKDRKLKNILVFTISSVNNTNQELDLSTKFTQEFIKAYSGTTNTLKYSLGKKETLLVKDLNITGSTESKILVRLIEISKPLNNFSDTNIVETNKNKFFQKVIKEFYYFNRTSINDKHEINKFIYPESEVYVDIQKLIESSDSDVDKFDTLSFTLNGIKIKIDENNNLERGLSVGHRFVMQKSN